MISFVISFLVAIVKGDCQLVYGIERRGFALFSVRYQILETIWQSLIVTMADDWIVLVQLCCILHEFHIVCCDLISWLHAKVVNEVSGILYWVWESKMDLEFVYKEVPGKELGLHCYAASKFSMEDNIWYTLYQQILN